MSQRLAERVEAASCSVPSSLIAKIADGVYDSSLEYRCRMSPAAQNKMFDPILSFMD
jgi:hypothetical protein